MLDDDDVGDGSITPIWLEVIYVYKKYFYWLIISQVFDPMSNH